MSPSGDLLAALLLAQLHHSPHDLALTIEKAVAGLQAVLRDTVDKSGVATLAAERTAQVRGVAQFNAQVWGVLGAA